MSEHRGCLSCYNAITRCGHFIVHRRTDTDPVEWYFFCVHMILWRLFVYTFCLFYAEGWFEIICSVALFLYNSWASCAPNFTLMTGLLQRQHSCLRERARTEITMLSCWFILKTPQVAGTFLEQAKNIFWGEGGGKAHICPRSSMATWLLFCPDIIR